MEIVISEELAAYMREKNKKHIAVEVASSDHSDFEVTELYTRLVTDSFADYLREKKKYRSRPAGEFELLLPQYRLHVEERVSFSLKKTWIFRRVVMEGIRL